jgi:hypothetical protein
MEELQHDAWILMYDVTLSDSPSLTALLSGKWVPESGEVLQCSPDWTSSLETVVTLRVLVETPWALIRSTPSANMEVTLLLPPSGT